MSGEGFAFFRWAASRRRLAVENLTRYPDINAGLIHDWHFNHREGYDSSRRFS